jgi:predicted Fe-Mo cluster-binding NifX family protein
MKAAFAASNDRIAPVFDVTRNIHVVEIASGRIVGESAGSLDEAPVRKALQLAELGVATLVCGAISRPLHDLVASYGIRVIPFVTGELREVIAAWRSDRLENKPFFMPGYGRRHRHARTGHGFQQRRSSVNGNRGGGGGMGRGGGGGMGRGMGRGFGRGGQGQGRMGGRFAAGPTGLCVCPQCGHQESHVRGVPCTQTQCPKCGMMMTRQ